MPVYRILCDENGTTAEVARFDADDDTEALLLLPIRGERNCELWAGERLVAKVPNGPLAPNVPSDEGGAG